MSILSLSLSRGARAENNAYIMQPHPHTRSSQTAMDAVEKLRVKAGRLEEEIVRDFEKLERDVGVVGVGE